VYDKTNEDKPKILKVALLHVEKDATGKRTTEPLCSVHTRPLSSGSIFAPVWWLYTIVVYPIAGMFTDLQNTFYRTIDSEVILGSINCHLSNVGIGVPGENGEFLDKTFHEVEIATILTSASSDLTVENTYGSGSNERVRLELKYGLDAAKPRINARVRKYQLLLAGDEEDAATLAYAIITLLRDSYGIPFYSDEKLDRVSITLENTICTSVSPDTLFVKEPDAEKRLAIEKEGAQLDADKNTERSSEDKTTQNAGGNDCTSESTALTKT
jgi:hypothetical protein